jgi:hypothetical protein
MRVHLLCRLLEIRQLILDRLKVAIKFIIQDTLAKSNKVTCKKCISICVKIAKAWSKKVLEDSKDEVKLSKPVRGESKL